MKPSHVEQMLKVLRPVVKNRRKAKQILEKYWSDKIAIVWTIDQVHRAANECERVVTNAEAKEILRQFFDQHNPQYGLSWEMLTILVDGSILGRKITRKELKAFVAKDIITVEARKQHEPIPVQTIGAAQR